ncbi:hypothetical protein TSUD_295330 [Trifolium subterraneum]|uniref:Exocyst subunit Exo70 family protein n=1 Tax=Trifolium subterraneum TaxID=3900 RepID=A0A2Z6NZJ7_TRISU|nr:hypothetical protein TSUD_295330 [Trifolium subterraneum]
MKALQQENSTLIEMLMEKLKDYLSDDSGLDGFDLGPDPDFMIKALPTEIIDNLHKIAKLMVSAGFKSEFSDVYSSSRRECLVESLSRLGFKKLNINENEDCQMLAPEVMEDESERWIKVSNVAYKILLPTERKPCDRVFFGFSSSADLSFMDVCGESIDDLVDFSDYLNPSQEEWRRATNIFKTMFDLVPESMSGDQSFVVKNEFA